MQQPFKEAFTFNKAERRGIFALLLIAFLLLIYDVFGPFDYDYLFEDSSFQYQVGVFLTTKEEKELKKQTAILEKKIAANKKPRKRKVRLYTFDPNLVTYKQWLDLGLSDKQARTIEKYKRKGGSFREPEDLRKIYCLSMKDYDRLSPYILITNLEEDFDEDEAPEIDFRISINEVSIEEIQCVKGIGPSFAKRIVKYRNLLGGYVNISQLHEVYGMDSIRYEQISPFFEVNTDSINHILINSASYSQMLRHPYITKELAYEITHYRKIHGRFKSLEELKKLRIMNDELYQKIYLYFALE